MGFINERKNILRAEDGPLLAVDKNGNEVQIGNGSISCNSLKCDEVLSFKYVDNNALFTALSEDDSEYFTNSLISDFISGNIPFSAAFSGFIKSVETSNKDLELITNTSASGLITPSVESIVSSYPFQYGSLEGVNNVDNPTYELGRYLLDVGQFRLEYEYNFDDTTDPSFTQSSASYFHQLVVREFADVDVFVEVRVETTDEVVSSFTYSIQIPQLINEGFMAEAEPAPGGTATPPPPAEPK